MASAQAVAPWTPDATTALAEDISHNRGQRSILSRLIDHSFATRASALSAIAPNAASINRFAKSISSAEIV
jgi:hypothetical protein